MKRLRSKNGRLAAKRKSAGDRAGGAVILEDLRQRLATQVANSAPEMVDATIGAVMKGQHQPMKYLFEMIGLYPAAEAGEKVGEDVLARTLLKRLEFPAEPEAAEQPRTPVVTDTVE